MYTKLLCMQTTNAAQYTNKITHRLTFSLGNRANGLKSTSIWHDLGHRIRLLECHAILSRFERHRDDRIYQSGRHGCVEYVHLLVGDSPRFKGAAELVIGTHLDST